MICVVIRGPTRSDVVQQLQEAQDAADLVELNLDKWDSRDLPFLKEIKTQFPLPMIFTLRQQDQGGNYPHLEEERLNDLLKLAEVLPDYMDLESSIPQDFIRNLKTKYPSIQIILSYHDFEGTPDHLDDLLSNMKQKSADLYKIATMANSSVDGMRMLDFLKRHSDQSLIGVAMGECGQFSRILGKIYGNKISYSTIGEECATAPGQIPARFLRDNYHYSSLSASTLVYGLIGQPVSESISHVTHNQTIRDKGYEAIYVKIPVNPNELAIFLSYVKKLDWRGLSVTMPLKETVVPLLDKIDPTAKAIGAVNTLVFKEGKCCGYNTDGTGALKAIEEKTPVAGKKVLMIGAGGAAKAVVYFLHHQGAQVIILNRDKARAEQLARQVGCRAYSLDEIEAACQEGYDLIINSTPVEMPIDSKWILPHKSAMDFKTLPQETEFLRAARNKNCEIIYGIQMFYYQAIEQFNFWF